MLEYRNKYYMVHNPNHPADPRQHPTKPIAIAEAKRLSAQHVGQTFYVLEA